MNLSELKAWAKERYQQETRRAAVESTRFGRRSRTDRAQAFLEMVEKIEEGERE